MSSLGSLIELPLENALKTNSESGGDHRGESAPLTSLELCSFENPRPVIGC
jgi:hypothetical protein